MNQSSYSDILEQLSDYLLYILLYDQGEPLLHERYPEFIQMAKSHKLYTCCSTNGQLLENIDLARRIVSSGLDSLVVSADGLEQRTYELYRRGGRLDNVVKGIQNVRKAREAIGKRYPKIFLQFLVLKHNEHELVNVREKAKEWGVDGVLFKSAYVHTAADAEALLPKNKRYRRYRIISDNLQLVNRAYVTCRRPWISAVVHWDGRVIPCCFDKDNRIIMGRTTEQTLVKIWRDVPYNMFRQRLLTGTGPDICNNCTEGIRVYR